MDFLADDEISTEYCSIVIDCLSAMISHPRKGWVEPTHSLIYLDSVKAVFDACRSASGIKVAFGARSQHPIVPRRHP